MKQFLLDKEFSKWCSTTEQSKIASNIAAQTEVKKEIDIFFVCLLELLYLFI